MPAVVTAKCKTVLPGWDGWKAKTKSHPDSNGLALKASEQNMLIYFGVKCYINVLLTLAADY